MGRPFHPSSPSPGTAVVRWAGLLALLVAALAVSAVRSPAQEAKAAEDAAPPGEGSEASDPVDRDVFVARSMPKLAGRLATIETEVARGWSAHYGQREQDARSAFGSAMTRLLALRRELLELEGINPMVRMRNLRTGRFSQEGRAETYRPFTAYMTAWISRMPEPLHEEMEKRYGAEARAALKAAVSSQDPAALRDMIDTHYFTTAGMRGLELLVSYGMEQGDFLDVASGLLTLRETRPSVWRGSPMHAFRLLLSLAALGDQELLGPMEDEIARDFPSARVVLGREELPLMDAYRRARERFSGPVAAPQTAFSRFGEHSRLPLASESESGQFTVDDSGNDYGWGWTSWGYSMPVLPTEFHLQPLVTGRGIIVPRLLSGPEKGESWYMWYGGTGSATEWKALSMSGPLRHPVVQQSPDRRNRWVTSPQNPLQRVFGMAEGSFLSLPRTGALEGKVVNCLAAGMTSGHSGNGAFTGGQIHVFDAESEGTLLMSLPLPSQVKPAEHADVKDEEPDDGSDPEETPKDLDPEGREAALSDAEVALMLSRTHFCGVPLVADNCLYTGGSISNRSTTEYRVYCFDLSGARTGTPGKLMWHTRISGTKGQMDYYGSRSNVREGGSLIKSGNRIIAMTNHGTLASVDARDGAILWAVAYRLRGSRDRSNSMFGRSFSTERPVLRPEAPVLVGTTVVGAPSDGVAGISVDGCSGTVFADLLNNERQYEVAGYFLGTWGGRSYFQTNEGVTGEPFAFESKVIDAAGGWVKGQPLKLTGAPKEFAADFRSDVKGMVVESGPGKAALLLAGEKYLYRFDAVTLAFMDNIAWPDWEGKAKKAPASGKDAAKVTAAKPANRKKLAASLTLVPGQNGRPPRLALTDPFAMRMVELLP